MPEFKHLRIVVAAADAGSFSTTAQRLNIDVSVVSRVVRDLELSIGISIFDRLPRGVRLTAAGTEYVTSARDILARVERAREAASLAAAGSTGRLSIGFVWSFSSGPVVELLRKFTMAYPGVSIRTVEDGNEKLVASLEANELDVVLAATDPPPLERLRSIGTLQSMPLWLEPLCVMVPNAFVGDAVSWFDLVDRHLLCRPEDDWRHFVTHVKRQGGPTLRFEVQHVSREGLLGLVSVGFGWLIIPSSMSGVILPGLRVVPIASEGAQLQIEALWHPRSNNPVLTRLLALAQQMFVRERTTGADDGQLQTPDR